MKRKKRKTPIVVERRKRISRISAAELQDLMIILGRESERGAALVGLAFVEDALGHALATRLQGNEKAVEYLLGGQISSKLRLALALGLIERGLSDECSALASIRNEFAHSRGEVSFTDSQIAKSCQSLHFAELMRTQFKYEEAPRFLFESTASLITSFLDICVVAGGQIGTDAGFDSWERTFVTITEEKLKEPAK